MKAHEFGLEIIIDGKSYYIANVIDNKLWITDDINERYNPNCSGWFY